MLHHQFLFLFYNIFHNFLFQKHYRINQSNYQHLQYYLTTQIQLGKLWQEFPERRIRLKHVGGGGGKGQRVINHPEEASDAVMEVL